MEVKKDFVVQPVVKRSGSMAFLLVTILPLEHRWHMHPRYRKAADTLLPIPELGNRRERRQGHQQPIHWQASDVLSRSRPL